MHTKHLWQGEWISDETLQERLESINKYTNPVLGTPFALEYFLELSQQMHNVLSQRGTLYNSLLDKAMQTHGITKEKAEEMLQSISAFITKKQLQTKLSSELGNIDPFDITRPSFKDNAFESWAPMGVLVHIAPTNVFTVGILCVIEGLLSGNINILKTSVNQQQLPQLFFEALLALDTQNRIKPYVIILEVSSKEKARLQQVIESADVVSAWGSEEAIKSVRAMTPQGVRVVEWGHKISFAYFSKEHHDDFLAMEKVCEDITLLDQNACSSPQDIFFECESFDALKNFATAFASVLRKVASRRSRAHPESAQQAEITTVISVARTEQALGLTHVIEDKAHEWCVIADSREGLSVSPLYRTIWIKPLPMHQIISTLHPMKSYLQTAALIAPKERVIALSHQLLGAGCLRIKSAGHMHDNYVGEPHDGVYALPSFMKRISLDLGDQMTEIGHFDAFETPFIPQVLDEEIMDKTRFQTMGVADENIDLTFKSGGSSGKTTYSYYTYDDYHIQMQACALGLYSAGLDPKTDKVLNMFAAGHLYGGFLSFYSILEYLKVPQYPMGLVEDFESIGRFIVEKRINTLFSAPALLIAIFEHNIELFKKERIVKKLFFGGDHFSKSQIDYLQHEFGVEMIRAAAYGSNDAGPLGYQCPHCNANEYHLLSKIQTLEVVNLHEDTAVENETIGRLIFTSKQRSGQNITRYDVGDTGFLHVKSCACGRKDPKFTLLGRSSDAFKAGGPFLHVDQFLSHLEKGFNYTGLIQLILEERNTTPILTLRLEPSIGADAEQITAYFKTHFEDLVVTIALGVTLDIQLLDADKFEVVTHSGKVRHLIDKRNL